MENCVFFFTSRCDNELSQEVVDGLVSLELLDALLKDLDVDTTEDHIPWSPTCRKIHAIFDDDQLHN